MKHLKFQLTGASLEKPPPELKVNGYGARVEFLGVVRPEEAGSNISALDYEAYHEMAVDQGRRLLVEISKRHRILAMQVFHRTGCVRVGRISLRIRVYAQHRQEALAACSDFIERLKQDVPIWKHPVPVTGTKKRKKR